MKLLCVMLTALLSLALAACTGAKPPPGWPAGDERPINPPHLTRTGK